MMRPNYFKRLWILYSKEWFRLKRNPAAVMSVGLIILMAFLISIEHKASQVAKKQALQPCAVVYAQEDALIQYLKQHPPKQPVRFVRASVPLPATRISYPANIRCAVEIGEVNTSLTSRQLQFKAIDAKTEQFNAFSRWVLASVASQSSGVQLVQSLKPLQEKKPSATLSNIDLDSNQAKGMIGAMMLFSAQFFCVVPCLFRLRHTKKSGAFCRVSH